MSQIAYDPVKDKFAGIIRNSRFLRWLFYLTLDLFFLRSWHVRKILRELKHTNGDKINKILDAGNGFGQYDRVLLNIFSHSFVKAVDVKDDYLDDCRFYFKKQIENGRMEIEKQDLLEYKEPGYDLVLCVDVLEHIHEDVRVMKNMFESLNLGGFFLMHSPSHLAEEDAGDDEFFVDEHARAGYSNEDISKKLKLAGFNPVKILYTYGKFGHAAWVMLIKLPMLFLNRVGFFGVLLLPFWYILTLLPSLILMLTDTVSSNQSGTGILALAQKSQKQTK